MSENTPPVDGIMLMKKIGAWLVFLFGEYCMVTNALVPTPLHTIGQIGNFTVAGLVALMVVGPWYKKGQNVEKEMKLVIAGGCLIVLSVLEVVFMDLVWQAYYELHNK